MKVANSSYTGIKNCDESDRRLDSFGTRIARSTGSRAAGPFARLTFVMKDGGKLTFDTLEFADILRAIYAH